MCTEGKKGIIGVNNYFLSSFVGHVKIVDLSVGHKRLYTAIPTHLLLGIDFIGLSTSLCMALAG